jgi:MFS family permease
VLFQPKGGESMKQFSADIKQYLIVTGNYWAFTLTDGALRMLVVLYFHQLGYSPLAVAMLFLFYEIFGVITNLLGGWLGARLGLNRTMNIGLFMQIVALAMLLVPTHYFTVVWVMAAQALSGIAKDLNKMSAKSAVKLLVPSHSENNDTAEHTLFKWVAILTGSKNALKGVGFFLGGVLLTTLDFQGAIFAMVVMLTVVWLLSLVLLAQKLGKAKHKPKFTDIFSKSRAINVLSAARLFLFASRDVWFVVALPVYLSVEFAWDFWWVGGFMASWVIGYGAVQAIAPKITGVSKSSPTEAEGFSKRRAAVTWSILLAIVPLVIGMALAFDFYAKETLLAGLLLFGVVFAINSSLHSYLIVSYADSDGVSLDVGFYYMANAMGRLVGTVLSGWLFQQYGLAVCLYISASFIVLTAIISMKLPEKNSAR